MNPYKEIAIPCIPLSLTLGAGFVRFAIEYPEFNSGEGLIWTIAILTGISAALQFFIFRWRNPVIDGDSSDDAIIVPTVLIVALLATMAGMFLGTKIF